MGHEMLCQITTYKKYFNFLQISVNFKINFVKLLSGVPSFQVKNKNTKEKILIFYQTKFYAFLGVITTSRSVKFNLGCF